jgi:hypothetical protein
MKNLTKHGATINEVEQLKRELIEAKEQLEHAINPVHSCGQHCQRPACVMRRERDQWKAMAERLASCLDYSSPFTISERETIRQIISDYNKLKG